MDRRTCAMLVACLGMLLAPRGASGAGAEIAGIEVELHGSYELQLRGIARDFDFSDGLDLTQWYDILNLELEFDFAPDGWGPFDVLQAFARVEVRYDCVWTRGCGIFSSADAFGNRAKRLPGRLNDGRRAGFDQSGTLFTGDTRFYADIPREQLPFEFKDVPRGSSKPCVPLQHRPHRHAVRLARPERHLRRRRRPGALLLLEAPRSVPVRVPRHERQRGRGRRPEPDLEPGAARSGRSGSSPTSRTRCAPAT